MTREDSIRTQTWVSEDGRYQTVDKIADDHLDAIRAMLRRELTPGYDEAVGRQIVTDFLAKQESKLDYTLDLELDEFRSAWLQIIDNEITRRTEKLS